MSGSVFGGVMFGDVMFGSVFGSVMFGNVMFGNVMYWANPTGNRNVVLCGNLLCFSVNPLTHLSGSIHDHQASIARGILCGVV